MKKALAMILAICLTAGLCGCNREETPTLTVPTATVHVGNYNEIFSDRDFDDTYADAKVLELSGTQTITSAGTYLLQGNLENGQVIVAAGEQDKVQLVLAGVSITASGTAPIYIASADKVFITLAEGTENTLTCTGDFVQTDENNVDAAIFAKCDLTFNGKGKLQVDCEKGHGIASKDELVFTGGTYHITAAGQGISGKDSLNIADGDFTIQSGTDGLQSKHDENAEYGNIYIAGGSFHITAGTDGMDASNTLAILGGSFTVTTGGGSAAGTQGGNDWGGFPGHGGGYTESTDTGSYKGLKAAVAVSVSGGSFTLDTQDDAIHSNDTVQIAGGEFTIAAGDDGVHADKLLHISDGGMTITKSYEGLESASISITGGQINLVASDDGLNAAGGNDGSGTGGPWGGGDMFASDGSGIVITGGTLVVNASGDGLDSNGTIAISGGCVFVDGPTNSGNGGMDYAESATVTGGTVFVLGASGMAQGFSAADGQGAIAGNVNTQAAGTIISISDEKGNVLASYTSQKQFSHIVVSAPGMEENGTYTLSIGGQTATVTLDGFLYGSGGGMGPGGMGPGGNRPGGRPR